MSTEAIIEFAVGTGILVFIVWHAWFKLAPLPSPQSRGNLADLVGLYATVAVVNSADRGIGRVRFGGDLYIINIRGQFALNDTVTLVMFDENRQTFHVNKVG